MTDINSPRTIKEALEKDLNGFYIGNRLILPFHCQFIKMIVENEIITEFKDTDDVKIHHSPKNTSVYFRYIGRLKSLINSYKNIKIIIAEYDVDLCDINNHYKLICDLDDNHLVKIYEPDENVIFIE